MQLLARSGKPPLCFEDFVSWWSEDEGRRFARFKLSDNKRKAMSQAFSHFCAYRRPLSGTTDPRLSLEGFVSLYQSLEQHDYPVAAAAVQPTAAASGPAGGPAGGAAGGVRRSSSSLSAGPAVQTFHTISHDADHICFGDYWSWLLKIAVVSAP